MLCSSSNRKNSNKNKEIIVSEKNEKSLRDWKLPPFPSSYAFEPSGCCSLNPHYIVKTVEKKISLREGYTTIPLLSECRIIAYSIWCDYLQVGMIQVGLKPKKLGSNTNAIMCVRDKRRPNYHDSILGMVESSLCDGPIYFSCGSNQYLHLSASSCDAFNIDVKIEGFSTMHGGDIDGNITLMYRFHYIVRNMTIFSISRPVDEEGETTLYVTKIAQSNRVVSKTISWGETKVGEGLVVENNLLSGTVGNAYIDWKETGQAHVLKVDVPGFKKEQVKIEVEEGRILLISGERSNEEEEEEVGKWYCEERTSGKFLRRLRLPENANLDELKAGMENGVLTVTVPKEGVDSKKPQVKIINISG